MNISAEFVKSAARASDFPKTGVPEVAWVGRSNVGKSSLINALVRRSIARTSAAPGKTRLANIYRVVRGSSPPVYMVDLPGYGFARGGSGEFERLTAEYFSRTQPESAGGPAERARREGSRVPSPKGADRVRIAVLLVVDSRHPGLTSDVEAWHWLQSAAIRHRIVATKIDKLARGQRIRAQRELESAFDDPVLPVSADTGEGLDELWKLIDQLLAHNPEPKPRSRTPPPEQAPPPRPPRR